MERLGYIPAIQGGGAGVGFKVPRQICDYEPQVFSKLRLQLISSFDAAENCEIEENEESKRLVWKREAEHRFNTLFEQKRVVRKDCTPVRSMNVLKQIGVNNGGKNSNNQDYARVELQKDSLPFGNISEQDTVRAVDLISTDTPRCKFIPDLPGTIEDVVRLWRYGEKETGFKPVRLYLTASTRRSIIKKYTDKYWNKSGQKAAFYRFKDLAEFVTEHGPATLALKKEGKDKAWAYGIENVKKLKLFTKPKISMSALLRFVREDRKVV